MAGTTTKKPTQANQQSGGVQDFTVISNFKNGYRNREDITTLPPGVLVAGSENVLTNTYQRVGIRKGYTLDGAANTALAPIGSSFDFLTSRGFERPLRNGFLTSAGNDGKLQARFVKDNGDVEWVDLLTALTTNMWNFTTFWNVDLQLLELLAVDGTPNIFEWFGGAAQLLSTSSTSGIIEGIFNTPQLQNGTASGGINYTVGDRLTITGGGGNAIVQVLSVVTGAVGGTTANTIGTGYLAGDVLSIAGGGGAVNSLFAQITIDTVSGGGAVTSYHVSKNGWGYSTATGVACTGGTGTGFTLDIIQVGGGAISNYSFVSDADRGTGYSTATNVATTGGTGTNATMWLETVSGATHNITVKGTATINELGFVVGTTTNALQQITINGTVYSYNNLEYALGDTTIFYDVSPDPSGEAVDSIIVQTPHVYANGVGTNIPPLFRPTLISALNQRVYLGAGLQNPDVVPDGFSLAAGGILISEQNDFKVYGSGDSGVPGAPFQIFVNSAPTAFIPQEEFMYISAGHDEWYKVSYTLDNVSDGSGGVLSNETVKIERLNTTYQQASQSQAVTNKISNSIVFLSFEPYIQTFGRVDNIFGTPQMTELSYPIVNDMNSYDWTNAAITYYRKFVYVAVPREGLVLMYNMTDPLNQYWEAPQRMPISRFSIINGDLYGHSSQVSETYKLFDGTNDNGFDIVANVSFAFNNYGTRTQSKGYNEFYVEGYISPNTTLNLGVQYDIDGCATTTSFDIDGTDAQIVCLSSDDASLGKTSLGKHPLGSGITAFNNTPKFRVIKTFPIRYFYEDQISFSSEGIDQQWEIIAFGPQLLPYTDLNNKITQ